MRAHRLLPLTCVAFVLSACEPTTPSISAVVGTAPPAHTYRMTTHPRLDPAAITTPRLPETSEVRAPILHTERPAPMQAAIESARPIPHLVMDASNVDAFTASLQQFEAHLAPKQLDFIRMALTAQDGQVKARLAQEYQRRGRNAQLSEHEIFALAYGPLHGRTAAQLIEEGKRTVRQHLLTQTNAAARQLPPQ
jgi:hypothetical protein